MNNTRAGNELADSLELLLLDITENYNIRPTNKPILSHWSYHPTTTQSGAETLLQQLMQDGLAAIQLYRDRTGTQRVRPAVAVID